MDVKKTMVAELKKEGLDIAEETVVKIVKAGFKTAKAWCLNHANAFVNAIGGFLPMLEKPVLELVDKIDGEDDQAY
ncbi:hypothetical protein [Flavobacterium alkalisoli]|uniref:hypothetical protein n=1 Tax=Flavobacterium alkalisoli TaxID=2602769 RepID=UPI003A91DBB4